VAIKRLHPHLAKDPDFVSMFLDEARLAARIRHPNVVPTLDVVSLEDELFLVMEYVEGESFAYLLRRMRERGEVAPTAITIAIMLAVLHGLHAAHEATSERGELLHIVHRDVSPQNILVGVDGVARVLDFGVAKAAWRLQTTRAGQLKGKLAYMAPEQLAGSEIDRRVDVFAASVVLWEALTGRRLFQGETPQILAQLRDLKVTAPSEVVASVPPELDRLVMRGLHREVTERFATAHEMAVALEQAGPSASQREISEWVRQLATTTLSARAARVAEIESVSSVDLMGSGADATAAPSNEPAAAGTAAAAQQVLAAPPLSRRARVRPRTVLFAALTGTLFVAGAGVAAHRVARRDTASPAIATPSASSVASDTSTVAPPAGEASASPSVPTASAPPVVPSAVATGSATPLRPSRPSSGTTPVVRSGSARKCDPPYTVDTRGIHHPKMECL
jgi:serine/threonine-protein kinase